MTVVYPATNCLIGSNLISIADISREQIDLVIRTAQLVKTNPNPDLLKGLIISLCFFEPSTRTRFSFETAMLRAGGSFVGFADASTTSSKKGESLADMMRVIDSYGDLIVIRHPLEGAARVAADVCLKPVINAGDGANQHPTQALIDLFSIFESQGRIESLHVVLAGDLQFGRTIHSLSLALAHYGARLYFVSPEFLSLPNEIQNELRKKGIKFSFHSSLESVISKADILYMTRIQKERFTVPNESFFSSYRLLKQHLTNAKPHLKILHPLPRIHEIEQSIDSTDYAYYFEQAANGVSVRMALLALILGRL